MSRDLILKELKRVKELYDKNPALIITHMIGFTEALKATEQIDESTYILTMLAFRLGLEDF